jgi:putative Mg2+ transporter-C (MgtC) family protein
MDATFLLDIGVALLLGLAIGVERQFGQHPAGLRTNALVCMGAAVFVSLSRLMAPNDSPTRIAAQVVSGIGFLGGGVILREGLSIRGLTTAATLWCSAAVGSLAGAGHPYHAATAAATIVGINLILLPLDGWIDRLCKRRKNVDTNYRLRVVCQQQQEGTVRAMLVQDINVHASMGVQGISTRTADQPGSKLVVVDIESTIRDDHAIQEIMSRVTIEPGIASASWERLP